MIVIIGKKATIWMRRLTFGFLLSRESNDSVSKASWPHDISDPSEFLPNVAKLPTNLNYLRTYPEYTMYSMCPNSGVASRTPSVKSTTKCLISKMTFLIESTRILDSAERVTRRKKIKFLKVQWSHHSEKEATLEREDRLCAEYPSFLPTTSESRDKILLSGGELSQPKFR